MTRYQQLAERVTGRFDCTGWTFALLANIDSGGAFTFTGRQVRLASDEPIPEGQPGNPPPPGRRPSPGLNFPQADAAVDKLTKGRVNLDVRVGRNAATVAEAEKLLRAGHFAGVQVRRDVLRAGGVGLANRFGGGHAIVAGYDRELGSFVIGDPLIPDWEPVHPDVLWRAAASLVIGGSDAHPTIVGAGRAYMAFTRDVVAENPKPQRFNAIFEPGSVWVYTPPQGVIGWMRVSRVFAKATSAACTEPVPITFGGRRRKLVKMLAGGLAGKFVEPGTTHVRTEAV